MEACNRLKALEKSLAHLADIDSKTAKIILIKFDILASHLPKLVPQFSIILINVLNNVALC